MSIHFISYRWRSSRSGVACCVSVSDRLCLASQAIACRLLPGAHWALLYVIAVAFVLSFIMFESGGSFSNEGRHTLWTMLCALMVFVLTVRAQGFLV